MFDFIKKLFKRKRNGEPKSSFPEPDIPALISQIKKREDAGNISPGQKIHAFDHGPFTIRIDRDITKNHRITIWQGSERIYSFTVYASQGEYEKLEKAYEQVIQFLESDQSLSDLPSSDLLKGFYYGH